MSTYLFVHGAWMGKFAWNDIIPRLEAQGHDTISFDLPAHGADQTPAASVSLDSYRDAVLDALGDRTDVVLVGHSMAGVVIATVAEARPSQIKSLVFVCAYLPRNGESVYGLSQEDTASQVGPFWRQDDPANYSPAWISSEGIVPVFGADCSAAQQALLIAEHRPEPVPPLATPVALTAERYGTVPRFYIETLHDACVSHQLQTLMLSRTAVTRRFQLATGHTPFFTAPDQLVASLLESA